MQQQSPLVTVLMTVFNAEQYLAASIESVLQQTFTDWEFIIVDDASSDASLNIINAYALQDARIRVIPNLSNKGQTACLNQGLNQAQGQWIARQDADDISHPERLEKQTARVVKEPSLALLGTCGIIIDKKNRRIGLLDEPLTQELIVWSAPFLNPFLHTAVLFKAQVARSLGGYDEHYRIAQDYDLWVRILLAGYLTANSPERLVNYRHLDSSLSKVGKSEAFQEAASVSKKIEEYAFGRFLKQEQRDLLACFRSGTIISRKSFWRLYQSLQTTLPQNKRVSEDLARLTTTYHLKIAGRCSSHLFLMVAEMGAALIAHPRFFVHWISARFF